MQTRTEKILEERGSERRINYDLSRFTQACLAVGSPEKTVNSVVVSGTNGKGSVTLFLSAALAQAGRRVTTFLSPHLQDLTERLLHNLRAIDATTLERLAETHLATARRYELSYFEYLTLLYFIWVKEVRPDVQIVEVGLGGRLDATNVTLPLACVLTNISWDHQAYLGNTLPEILNEKMGTFRPRVPVYSTLQPELRPLLEARALALQLPLDYPDFIPSEVLTRTWDGQHVTIDGHPFFLRNPSPAAVTNAKLAYLALRMSFPDVGIESIRAGFASVVNPGRLETVATAPRVVLSGDHNPAGLEALIETLELVREGDLHIVAGFSPDKPYREMYDRLKPLAKSIRLTSVLRLRDKLPADYAAVGNYVEDAKDAVRAAIAQAGPRDTVLVTGSLYLVGEVRPLWRSTATFFADPPTAR